MNKNDLLNGLVELTANRDIEHLKKDLLGIIYHHFNSNELLFFDVDSNKIAFSKVVCNADGFSSYDEVFELSSTQKKSYLVLSKQM